MMYAISRRPKYRSRVDAAEEIALDNLWWIRLLGFGVVYLFVAIFIVGILTGW
jgi:hypothetical protein